MAGKASNDRVYGDESDPRVQHRATNGEPFPGKNGEKLANPRNNCDDCEPWQRSWYSVNDLTTRAARALNFKSSRQPTWKRRSPNNRPVPSPGTDGNSNGTRC